MASYPPSCYDRADGLAGRPGTATPPGAVVIAGPNTLEEDPESPQIERGDQATIVHQFRAPWETCLAIIATTALGTVQRDSFGNITQVLSAEIQHLKGDQGRVRITSEALTFDPPIDEFTVDTEEVNPALEKHPRYRPVVTYNVDSNGNAVNPAFYTGPNIINIIKNALYSPVLYGGQEASYSLLNSTSIGDPDVLSLALEMVRKLRKGFETFYLAGLRVRWTQFFYLPQDMNPGGYIEDPVTQGGLPFYFWSDDGTPTGNNILTALAATVNPQIYDGGISWFRQSDTQHYNRTWFGLTRSWIGAPLGIWDSDIYPHAE